jgi:uncharacterized Zn finger protein
MTTLPKLTDKTIERRVGERSFNLGRRYFQDGAIFDARRQGNTIKARCQGSRGEPYRVEATLGDKEVVSAECSCPVGGGGRCKHVAALLLAWRNSPEEFTEIEELAPALEKRSKKELIGLIQLMLRKEPDLELLLEAPLPGAGAGQAPATAAVYRKQAEAAFRRGGYEWGAAIAIADDLEVLTEIGDGFLKQKDFAGAAAVYQGVLTALFDNYNTVQDEEGDFHGVVNQCVEGLEKCLKAAKDDPERRLAILRTFFDICSFDIEQGGIGLSDDVPDLVKETTPEERKVIAGWVREAMPRGKDFHDNWRRESFGSFLLNLEADTLDDEAFIRSCRETGNRSPLVARLLELGRLPEALKEIELVPDYQLTQFADMLVAHGHGAEADRLVEEKAKKSTDWHLADWLKRRAARRGDTGTVLALTEKSFHQHPNAEGYKEIRKLAQKLGRWDALRPELLAVLKKAPYSTELIRVYLDEGDIDNALAALKSERKSAYGYGFYGYSLAQEVAKAAEKTRPQAALEIYRKEAEVLIAQRGRGSYQEACKLLKKVRDLHKRLGEDTAWTNYLAKLREQNRTLRAFLEELTKAKL